MKKKLLFLLAIELIISSAIIFSSCDSDEESEPVKSSSVESISDSEEGPGDDSTTEQKKNEETEYIEVTVSSTEYIYENKTITFEDLKDEILNTTISQVKITDDDASQKAYRQLTDFLDDNSIEYFNEE